jgi:hypothetical protein
LLANGPNEDYFPSERRVGKKRALQESRGLKGTFLGSTLRPLTDLFIGTFLTKEAKINPMAHDFPFPWKSTAGRKVQSFVVLFEPTTRLLARKAWANTASLINQLAKTPQLSTHFDINTRIRAAAATPNGACLLPSNTAIAAMAHRPPAVCGRPSGRIRIRCERREHVGRRNVSCAA